MDPLVNDAISNAKAPSGSDGVAADTVDDRFHKWVAGANRGATVGNALFNVVSGGNPRLFIQVVDEDQRSAADRLRRLLQATTIAGAPIVAPGVEKVESVVKTIELRYLKRGDKDEGDELARVLTRLTAQPVTVKDFSNLYEARADVKPRTYELWYPSGVPIFRPFARESDIDLRGDYVAKAVEELDSCEDMCRQDSHCKGYTFLAKGVWPNKYHGPPGPFCWLKNPLPAKVPYAGIVSGVKVN